jgi:hypothetical protein
MLTAMAQNSVLAPFPASFQVLSNASVVEAKIVFHSDGTFHLDGNPQNDDHNKHAEGQ